MTHRPAARAFAFVALLLAGCPAMAAEAPAPAKPAVADAVLKIMRPEQTYEEFLLEYLRPYRVYARMHRDDASVTRASIERSAALAEAEAKRAGIQAFFQLGGVDVTRVKVADLRDLLMARRGGGSANAGYLPYVENQVRELSQADANHDGVVDVDEMQAYGLARRSGYNRNDGMTLYLTALPGDGPLTASGLVNAAQAMFVAVDKDGDTVLSKDEIDAVRPRVEPVATAPVAPVSPPYGTGFGPPVPSQGCRPCNGGGFCCH